jgi:solute carrier family 25 (mitochondrial phosphate transporter), member 3
MAKFVVYEKVSELVYQQVDKKSLSDGMQTTVNLGSGLIAGFAAALVSQPADTMLSKINKTKGLPGEGTTSRLIKIAKELGLRGSYTGIGARLFMVRLTAVHTANQSKLTPVLGWYSYRRSIRYLRRCQEGSWCHWRCRDREINFITSIEAGGFIVRKGVG